MRGLNTMVKSSTHEEVIACLVYLQISLGDNSGTATWVSPETLVDLTGLSKSVIHNSMHEYERDDIVVRRELHGQGQPAYEWALVDAVEFFGDSYMGESDNE